MPTRSRPIALAVAAVAALAIPTTADAKGIERVSACGTDGCSDVTQRLGIERDTHAHVILGTGRRASAPQGARFARIEVGLGDGTGTVRDTITLLYAPGAGRLRSLDELGDPAWFTVRAEQRAALRTAIDGVALFPASRLAAASRPVAEPAPVARVVEVFEPAATPAATRPASTDGPPVLALVGGAALFLLLAVPAARARGRRRVAG